MEIIVGKLSGFCKGVSFTVNKAQESLKSRETIYCLGEIVHNERVIKDLENLGMITVDDINLIPDNAKTIFRAHGESKETYDSAKAKNLDLIDLTCGKIKVIRKKIEDANKDSFIVIIGKKNHPETIGNISFCKNSYIVQDESDIEDAFNEFTKTGLDKVYILAQTTFLSKKFEDLVEIIKAKFSGIDIVVDKTICNATEDRQKETRELSKVVDKMIIIGGKLSSNTKELETISKENCNNVYLVQSVMDLDDIEFSKTDKIGIMAGASTPNVLIEEVVDYLNGLN